MQEANRLQTRWNVTAKRWEIFLSMSNNSQRQVINNEFASIERKFGNELDLADPKVIKEIYSFLESNSNYEVIEKRENDKKRAVFACKKQKYPIGYILGASLTVIGAALLAAIVPNAIDIKFNQDQVDDNQALSYISVRNESVIVFSVVFALGAILAVLNYIHTHKKHIDEDVQYEHKTIHEFLGRLKNIRKEVELKNRVLSRIESFLKLKDESFDWNDIYEEVDVQTDDKISKDKKGKKHTQNISYSYKDRIIMALDSEDDLGCWQSVDQTLRASQQRLQLIYPHIFSDMKLAFINEYQSLLVDTNGVLSEEITNLKTVKGLFDVAKGLPISEANKALPMDFIYLCFAQAVQNMERWLVQDTLKRIFSNFIDSSRISLEEQENTISNAMISQYKISPESAKASWKFINKLSYKEQNFLKNAIEGFLRENTSIDNIIDKIMDEHEFKNILHNHFQMTHSPINGFVFKPNPSEPDLSQNLANKNTIQPEI